MKLIKVSYDEKATYGWNHVTAYINPAYVQRIETTDRDLYPVIYFTDGKTLKADRTHISEVLSQLEEGGSNG
jgi:hypothetical protein